MPCWCACADDSSAHRRTGIGCEMQDCRWRPRDRRAMNEAQVARIRHGKGFVAALDQSGGSTPGALARYGIGEGAWSSQKQMFELMHSFRTRIITSPAFTGEH